VLVALALLVALPPFFPGPALRAQAAAQPAAALGARKNSRKNTVFSRKKQCFS
jgi:hypothetical protein